MKPFLALTVSLALFGCASDQTPLWSGPDLSTPITSAGSRASPPLPSQIGAPIATPSSTRPQPRRAGGGTPPDQLTSPVDPIRPPTLAPLTSAPPIAGPPPSPLDLPGFQRTGPIAVGPGGVYNSVGSTIFGPGGKVCTPVGASLTCL